MNAAIGWKGARATLLVTMALFAHVWRARAQFIDNGDFELPGWVARGYDARGGTGSTGDDTIVYLATTTDLVNQTVRGYNVGWVELPGGSTYLQGWKVGGAGVYHHLENRPWLNFASSGNHCLQLHRHYGAGDKRGGSVEQTVRGLLKGTNYFLSLDLRQDTLSSRSAVTVGIGTWRTVELINRSFGAWQTHTIPFVALGDSMLLKIGTPSQTESGVWLDRIRLSTNANEVIRLQARTQTGIKVDGRQGSTYRIEWTTNPEGQPWNLLTRVAVTNGPVWVHEDVQYGEPARFYRSVEE